MFAYAKPEQKQITKSTVQKKKTEDKSARNLTGIPDKMKSDFESLSGFSFSDVRVHYSSDKPAQFQALAYTQGNQVYVAPGQEKHLRHELGHVVQQKLGIVNPTTIINGMKTNDNADLERGADTNVFRATVGKYGIHEESNYDNIIQRMPYNGMLEDLINEFSTKDVDRGLLSEKLNDLSKIPIIKDLQVEFEKFVKHIDFEKDSSEDGGGAQFVPIKGRYIIKYNFNCLWNNCEKSVASEDKELGSKIAVMVIAHIQHELTHAAVAVNLHAGNGVTDAEYGTIKRMGEEGTFDEELKAKYRSFSSNTFLHEYLPKINEICVQLKKLIIEENKASNIFNFESRKYLAERINYILKNDSVEIDSVLTDLCIYFNMNYPKSLTTFSLNDFAELCHITRKLAGITVEMTEPLDRISKNISSRISSINKPKQ